MENRLIALKLVMDELNVPVEIATLGDRKRVQKAIYLGQQAGVDLGYRFGWYLLGPYSSNLARDYFALSASIEGGEETGQHALRRDSKDSLARLIPIMTPPEGVELEPEDWLELLASLHFLRKVSNLSYDKSVEAMAGTSKERLLTFAPTAEKLLGQVKLI